MRICLPTAPQESDTVGQATHKFFFNTAAYLFDYATFSKKYIRDVFDWQQKDGKLPQIVPYGGVDFFMSWMNGSVGWSDVGVLLPYRFGKFTTTIA